MPLQYLPARHQQLLFVLCHLELNQLKLHRKPKFAQWSKNFAFACQELSKYLHTQTQFITFVFILH